MKIGKPLSAPQRKKRVSLRLILLAGLLVFAGTYAHSYYTAHKLKRLVLQPTPLNITTEPEIRDLVPGVLAKVRQAVEKAGADGSSELHLDEAELNGLLWHWAGQKDNEVANCRIKPDVEHPSLQVSIFEPESGQYVNLSGMGRMEIRDWRLNLNLVDGRIGGMTVAHRKFQQLLRNLEATLDEIARPELDYVKTGRITRQGVLLVVQKNREGKAK